MLPLLACQVEVLQLPKRELDAYRKFEKALQKEYLAVRHRLLNSRGSHTMAVLTLLTKFRQVCVCLKHASCVFDLLEETTLPSEPMFCYPSLLGEARFGATRPSNYLIVPCGSENGGPIVEIFLRALGLSSLGSLG